MATRFYLRNNGNPPYIAVPSGVWDDQATFDTYPTDTIKGNNLALGDGTLRSRTTATANADVLDRIYVTSRQLAAQTIAVGTYSCVMRAVESNTAADYFLNVVIRVMSADGSTQRGTLNAGTSSTSVVATVGAQNQEYPITTQETRIKSAIATTAVTAQAGDRIHFELGARGVAATNLYSFRMRYGDPAATADFALTGGLTTDLVPWIELSQNLTFLSPSPPVPSPYRRRLHVLGR